MPFKDRPGGGGGGLLGGAGSVSRLKWMMAGTVFLLILFSVASIGRFDVPQGATPTTSVQGVVPTNAAQESSTLQPTVADAADSTKMKGLASDGMFPEGKEDLLPRTDPVPPIAEDPRDRMGLVQKGRANPAKLEFTIVMLTYKAPRSLKFALDSFESSGLLSLPNLKEVLIYFQVLEDAKDRAMVAEWFNFYRSKGKERAKVRDDRKARNGGGQDTAADLDNTQFNEPAAQSPDVARGEGQHSGRGGDYSINRARIAPYRVIGTPSNLPVAKATFEALRQVQTEFVLYLECDRPIFPYFLHDPIRPKSEHLAQYQKNHRLGLLEAAGGGGTVVDTELLLERRVRNVIYTALTALELREADLFRMQLYANEGVRETDRTGRPLLRADIYGSDTYKNCAKAPTLTKAHCASAKQKYGNVYNTAYCKHWRKFSNNAVRPQNDLCDSFCFVSWTEMFHPRLSDQASTPLRMKKNALVPNDPQATSYDKANASARFLSLLPRVATPLSSESTAKKNVKGVPNSVESPFMSLYNRDALPNFVEGGTEKKKTENLDADVVPGVEQHLTADETGKDGLDGVRYYCLTSDECNWTNQPAMYRKAWYEEAIMKPCEGNVALCMGSPGRGSAVRQEVYFNKNQSAWGKKKYRVCLSAGLFYHHEVDNRE
jgi:hypothetical protein